MEIKYIVDLLQKEVGANSEIGIEVACVPPAIVVPAEILAQVGQILYEHPDLYFDYLACITAIDNGPQENTLCLAYNFCSIPFGHQLMVKVMLPRNAPGAPLPKVPTVSTIWRAADWQEREAYDLVGIHFEGHPNLKRILLPEDWEGYPLRTDYQVQDQYRGIATAYEDRMLQKGLE